MCVQTEKSSTNARTCKLRCDRFLDLCRPNPVTDSPRRYILEGGCLWVERGGGLDGVTGESAGSRIMLGSCVSAMCK